MRTQIWVAALLARLSAATPAAAATANFPDTGVSTEYIPVYYAFGEDGIVRTQLVSPFNQRTLEVCYDLGSDKFWVFGPNATINWGEIRLGWPGHCNLPVPEFNDWTADPTANGVAHLNFYETYGSVTKLVTGTKSVNQSLVFMNTLENTVTLDNTRLAIVDYIQWRHLDTDECKNAPFDQAGIMGVAPSTRSSLYNTTGPSVRQDALDRGAIGAATHCLWFDRIDPQGDYRELRTGGALWGGIDSSKFTGPLVKLAKLSSPAAALSNNYYVTAPRVSSGGQAMPAWTDWKTMLNHEFPACLLDSGAYRDSLPINKADVPLLLNATGLVSDGITISWPGPCSEVPSDRTLDFEFPGQDPSESVTIKTPLTNWVRYDRPNATQCELNFSTTPRCMFAAPFFSYLFFAADDERSEIAFAQGGVSERESLPDYSQVRQRI